MQEHRIPCKETMTRGEVEGFIRPAEGVGTPDKKNETAEAYKDIRVYKQEFVQVFFHDFASVFKMCYTCYRSKTEQSAIILQ